MPTAKPTSTRFWDPKRVGGGIYLHFCDGRSLTLADDDGRVLRGVKSIRIDAPIGQPPTAVVEFFLVQGPPE